MDVWLVPSAHDTTNELHWMGPYEEVPMYLLVRNRVKDYDVWRREFDGNLESAVECGLKVVDVWCDADDPNNVFFILEAANRERAEAFMAGPEAAESGRIWGVIDGDYHFVEKVT